VWIGVSDEVGAACRRRRKRMFRWVKSTRSISWSWLKQEKMNPSRPVTGSTCFWRHWAQAQPRRVVQVGGSESMDAQWHSIFYTALRVDLPVAGRYADFGGFNDTPAMTITLNGDRFELDQPLSVTALLARLDIDPRRVAVEHNLAIIRRQRFTDVILNEGDQVEIVNFVGGG